MEEIGGYFELGGYNSSLYHKEAIALNTATNAVIYLIKAQKIKKIYLPYYLCDCLDKIKMYCNVEYYKINKDFTPRFNRKLKKNEYLYIVNYFGLLDNDIIQEYKNIYQNIIVDNVQAFFQMPVHNVNTVYSCRKFFGVPDGAFLYTNAKLNDNILQDKSKNRFIHILGRLEEDANSYFNEYKNNEKLLVDIDLAYMSKSTKTILEFMQYDRIKKKRTENYKYLNDKLKDSNYLELKDVDGAYMYPYYTKNAEILRKKLLDNKIYIPVLWPNVLKQKEDTTAYDYALNVLILPCDQRYGKAEMDRIIKIIKGEV